MPAGMRRLITREDLLDAWLDARRYQRAHEDLRLFHSRRLRALQAVFATELERGPSQSPASAPDWLLQGVPAGAPDSWVRQLSSSRRALRLQPLFQAATEGFLAADSPFGGF